MQDPIDRVVDTVGSTLGVGFVQAAVAALIGQDELRAVIVMG